MSQLKRKLDGARSLAVACARAADEKKAERTVVLNVTGLTSVTDYLVIATASSRPHLKAVAETIEETVRERGGRLHHREGGYDSPWLLLDCHNVIVHVFDDASRRYYDLERLWGDARRVSWMAKTPGAKRADMP